MKLLLRTIILSSLFYHGNPRKTLISPLKSMAWTCSKCTFINPSSQKSTCQICLSSTSSSSSSPPCSSSSSSFPTTPKWSCKACTFLNPYHNTNCDVCGTRASAMSLSTLEDVELDSSVGSVFLPLQSCKRKNREAPIEIADDSVEPGGFRGVKAANKEVISLVETFKGPDSRTLKILSYNVWFREDLEMHKRMKALGDLIQLHSPDLICFQEVTPNIYDIFQLSSWWKVYHCSVSNEMAFTRPYFCMQNVLVEHASTVGTAIYFQLRLSSAQLVVETFKGPDSRTLKILSYNVWFREDLEMHKRMKALGDLIQLHSPDLICFQEVTPNIYDIFQLSSWWKVYHCSVSNEMAFTRPYFCMQLSKLPVKSYSCKPFSNSIMGRELCVAEVEVHADMPLVVATSHLESPCPAPPKWDQMFSKERVAQAQEVLNLLKKNENVIFCGDMNWDDKLDGQFPLLDGWVDAWVQLKPGENGWTYDTKSNQMLSGNRTLQKRLDRFVCNLRDFKIRRIDMIGMEPIPGLSYCKEKKVKKELQKLMLPVLPSDHYGLLLTICAE
ncbi:hypothetical protein TEA_013757 [Camellia sinensis var. sinensis]|uniref:RanBP2-type domain-containing protein n=1 Tax=Camellia sinensis var. sinensis TaxID=542762 RepID=A0A4S4EQ95_CAMSN|nr:hypothetical protein TEA_013757 [Camellia sinensis var. sinensis]